MEIQINIYNRQSLWQLKNEMKVTINSKQIQKRIAYVYQYRQTSLYARDRDSKNRLAYNEFECKKT